MTSVRKKPIMLGARKNTAEQEREQFQKSQEASFRKAINDEELPVKMKHVRNLIIGTHTDRNGVVFWSLVTLTPPLHTDISAWKFCHTLHLILRDGHSKVLRDSIRHIDQIKSMGDHFRHLPMGYGGLILKYCSLLSCKLNFHQHYPTFPGTLQVSAEELQNIAEHDANNFFEMAVEMLEYMENILDLYNAVFRSLDPSRANSMTKMGQCRLAPLIPCIQDSSCLYDFIVRILFQLHKVVPVDMLSGHRTRFSSQFKLLNQFYSNTRNLQYFKTLIQVPHLPQVPPNFLIEAELGSHVAPVVVIEDDPIDSESFLVDTSEPPPVPPHPHPDITNGSAMDAQLLAAERESIIDRLNEELKVARNAIQTLQSETLYVQDQLKIKINDLEASVAQLDSELLSEKESKQSLLVQVEAVAASAEAMTKLESEETKRRAAEDKYNKLKEVYLKLREEHISLIRTKADMEKCLAIEKDNWRKEAEARQDLEITMKQLGEELNEQNKAQLISEQMNREKQTLEKRLNESQEEKNNLLLEKETLENSLFQTKEQFTEQNKQVQHYMADIEKKRDRNIEDSLSCCIDSSILAIVFSLSHFDNESHRIMKATPEYTELYREPIRDSLDCLSTSYSSFKEDSAKVSSTIKSCSIFSHYVASFLLYAKATSHAAPDFSVGEDLISALEELSKCVTEMLEKIKERSDSIDYQRNSVVDHLRRCFDLVSKCEDVTPSKEDVASVIEKEMDHMEKAIREAVNKFNQMLQQSRVKDSGMQLEVNEGILGSCGDLMSAVRLLVQRASELQSEIVASGKHSGASPKEFYKRNHRWTEGLISGAKAVAIACQALVGAADEVANGRGKFEQVIVVSKEIAASSMQLVMASRVKADKSSDRLGNLNSAAKSISRLTGTVVATAESYRDKVTEATTLNFSNLTHHSAKLLEMETLVSVLEFETKLDRERRKLAQLRRDHYQLAGELEEE